MAIVLSARGAGRLLPEEPLCCESRGGGGEASCLAEGEAFERLTPLAIVAAPSPCGSVEKRLKVGGDKERCGAWTCHHSARHHHEQAPEVKDTATATTTTMQAPEKNNAEAEQHDDTPASSAFQHLEPLLITSATMPLPQDPDVTCGSLACGLRYYIKKNHKPEQRVALRLAVRVGSLQEEEAERGIAHMLEHLAFRATTNYGKLELVEYLESIGAAFGACQNAYTSFDETVYMLSVPSDGKDLVKQSIQVLHEWACRIRISDEDVEAERGIVLEEWRAGRSARCAPRQPASTPGPATHTRLPPWPDRACAWRLPQPLLAEWRRTTGSSSCRAASMRSVCQSAWRM